MKVWLILAAIVCALAFALLMDGQRMAPSPTETDAERLQSAREAFNVDATAQTHEGVAQWLAAMQTAISARDQQAVAGLFDAEKILEELQARGAVPRMALRERRAALQGLERGLGRSLMPGLLNEPWSTVELRKVESYDQDRQVVAYVRHRDQDGYGVRMRWWLVQRGDQWRAFDFEEVEMGLRMTVSIAAAMTGANLKTGQMPPWVHASTQLQQLPVLIEAGQLDTAESILDQIQAHTLPVEFDSVAHYWRVTIALYREDMDQAESAAAALRRVNQAHPMLPFIDALVHNGRGRWEQAAASAQLYIDQLGDDGAGYLQLGIALEQLGRRAEAIEALERGLKDSPEMVELVAGLAIALPEDRKTEAAEHYLNLPSPVDAFWLVVEQCVEVYDAAAVRVIVDARRTLEPDDVPDLDYYEAWARYMQDDTTAAAELLEKAWPRAPLSDRDAYIELYLDCKGELGELVEAYRRIPDARKHFDYAADVALSYEDAPTLAALMDIYREQHPDAWTLAAYDAKARQLAGEYEQAQAAYLAAAEVDGIDVEQRAWALEGSYICAYYGGRAEQAYAEAFDREQAFNTLWSLYFYDRDTEGLASLVAQHQSHSDDGLGLGIAMSQVHELRGDFDAALAVMRDLPPPAEDSDRYYQYGYQLTDMYAMTGDAAMVRVTGEQYLDQFDRAYCMAAAHIAAGDVNAAVDAVDAALEAGLSLHTFYAHPHLGGLLRSDDFAAFRARHAEPKSEPAEGESASSATVDAQAA